MKFLMGVMGPFKYFKRSFGGGMGPFNYYVMLCAGYEAIQILCRKFRGLWSYWAIQILHKKSFFRRDKYIHCQML